MLARAAYKDTITIYNYHRDPLTEQETYKRTVLHNVFWNEDSQSMFRKTGTIIDEKVALSIPCNANYLPPSEFTQKKLNELFDNWTIDVGADRTPTYILLGECPFEFGLSSGDDFVRDYIRPFQTKYEGQYHRAKDVNVKRIGSRFLWRIEVRC